jgi:8-oxo-dGTP diphosphatase
MTTPRYLAVTGIIRQGAQVLLVRQRGPADPQDTWFMPGGLMQDHELLTEAVMREVHEETGLEVTKVGPLAYVTHIDDPAGNHQTLAFVFEISEWHGALQPNDPDKLVMGLQFFSIPEALARLADLPWRHMREPMTAYLRGQVPGGAIWLYRQAADQPQLIR